MRLFSLILWNTSGYYSVGALAAEVRRILCIYVHVCIYMYR